MAGKGKIHYTKLPGYVPVTADFIIQRKNILNIPQKMRFDRCQAKNLGKAKALDKELGYEHHMKSNHLCDECRCSFRAGYGTAHLGAGFCIVHENSKEYGKMADEVNKGHELALRQGISGSTNWQYAITHPTEWHNNLIKASEEARGRIDLSNEIIAIRTEMEKILESFRNNGIITQRVKIKEKDENGSSERFEFIEADDVTKIKLLDKLAGRISSMAISNLKLTEDNVVSRDQFVLFGKAILSLAQRMAPTDDWYKEYMVEFARVFENVKTGRV